MSDLREEAEKYIRPGTTVNVDVETTAKLIDLLRQALEKKERVTEVTRQFVGVNEDGSERWVETEYHTVIRSEWVGLTDSEGAEIWADAHDLDGNRLVVPKEIVKRIEAKLKEKNT